MANIRFGIVDYVVFVGLLMVSMAIGICFGIKGRKKESTEQYLMGGRQLSLIPVSLSIIVSVMSSNSLMGNPAEVSNYHTIAYSYIMDHTYLQTNTLYYNYYIFDCLRH